MQMQFKAVSPPQKYSTEHLQSVSIRGQSGTKNATQRENHPIDGPGQIHQPRPEEISAKFNQLSDEMDLDVKFAYNEKIDQFYINVIDKSSGEVIRKLPSDEAMKIAESMKELVGTLFDKRG